MALNNSISPSSTLICESLYSGRKYLSGTQIKLLIGINLIIMVLNLIANSFIVYVLVSTKQLHNISIRLILYLSISDCFLALIDQPLFVVMVTVYSDSSNCTFETIVQFIFVFTKHLSGYIIVLIAYDRYLRMKHLKRYCTLAHNWKVRFAVGTVICFALLQGVIQTIATELNVFAQINIIVAVIDGLVIFAVFIGYIMTITVVKKHKENSICSDVLNNADQIVTRTASRIIIAVIIFYIPYLILHVLRHSIIDERTWKKRRWLNFTLFVCYELIFANSFANAVIFLNINRKSRSRLARVGISKLSLVFQGARRGHPTKCRRIRNIERK